MNDHAQKFAAIAIGIVMAGLAVAVLIAVCGGIG